MTRGFQLPTSFLKGFWEGYFLPCAFPKLAVSIVSSLHWSEHEGRREHEGGDWVHVAGRLGTVVGSLCGCLWESGSSWATPVNSGSQKMCPHWLKEESREKNQGGGAVFSQPRLHCREAGLLALLSITHN